MVARRQQTTQEQNEERYEAFIKNSNEGIWRFDLDEPVPTDLSVEKQIKHFYAHAYLAETNMATAKMYGFRSPKSMSGMKLGEFLIESDPNNHAYLKAFIESGYNLSGVESHEKDKKGRPKYFLNSLVGIVENGYLTHAWGTQQDVTDRKKTLEALQRSEERLSLALQASTTGLWEWDVATNDLYWSPELREIYGVDPKEIMTYEKYVEMIHPDDRDRANQVAYQSMQTGETYQFEHRIIRRDGTEHWLLGMGKAYLEDGKPVRMIGTSMNIDAVKQAQELRMLNTQLKTQRTELLALNKAKDEFIALASHQLRTPATAVKQYISLLMNEVVGPVTEEQQRYLQIAFNSNERQLRIINDLLKTAQIDSSIYHLKKQDYDFIEIVNFAVEELETNFELKNQKVVIKGPDSCVVNVDVAEMKLVMVNLLENASKYSYPKEQITVSLRQTAKYFEVRVSDKGVGIAKQDAKRIFDKFTRVDNKLSDTVSGTGLGLYWVKRIVRLHGGTINVQSDTSKGSKFTMRIPQ